jgi:hypothetical protein
LGFAFFVIFEPKVEAGAPSFAVFEGWEARTSVARFFVMEAVAI